MTDKQLNIPFIARASLLGILIAFCLYYDFYLRYFPGGLTSAIAFDYHNFWIAANAPLRELYKGVDAFVYPPSGLWLVKPLKGLPYWPGYAAWVILSLAAFIWAALRWFSWSAVALSLVSPIIVRAAMLGQTPLFLSALLLTGFAVSGVAAAVALGVIASVKPQLVFLAPIALLARREWQAIGVMAGAFVASVIIELVLFGPSLWGDWVAVMPAWHGRLIEQNVLSVSVGVAARAEFHGFPPIPFLVTSIVLGIVIIYKAAPKVEGAHLAALIVGVSAVAAPYSLPRDLVILAPLAAAVLLGKPSLMMVPAALFFAYVSLPLAGLLFGMVTLYHIFKISRERAPVPSASSK